MLAASGAAGGETVCPCWVSLRCREQGLSSRPDTHIRVLSTHTHPDITLRIPTHTETTQLVGRLKVTESYRYASKLRESDTGATHSPKYEHLMLESNAHFLLFFFCFFLLCEMSPDGKVQPSFPCLVNFHFD